LLYNGVSVNLSKGDNMQSAIKEKTSDIPTTSSSTFRELIRVYMWILCYLKPYIWQALLLIIYFVVITLTEMAFPKFIAYLIDYVAPQKQIALFINAILLLLSLIVIKIVLKVLKNQLERSVREQACRDLQYSMFRHLRKLGFTYYEQHPVGETLSLLNTNVAAVQNIYTQYLPQLVQHLLMLIISLTIIIVIDWQLTLMILPCYFLYYLGGPYIDKKSTEYLDLQTKTKEALNKKIYDNVAALVEIRAYGAEAWEMDRFLDKFVNWKQAKLASLLYRHLRVSLRWVSISVGILVLYLYGSQMVRNGMLTVGNFTAISIYYWIVMNSITRITLTIMEQSYIVQQAKLLLNFIQTKPQLLELDIPEPLDTIHGGLSFQNVHFHYPSRANVLNGFNADIMPGQKVALVGTSGGGKSTLIKLVGRFYDPTAGEIYLDGVPLTRLPLSQLREAIGYVFQETYLFGTTIRENIRFGKPLATDEEVEHAAKAAFAHEFIIETSDGYNTQVGERGIKLSGGQKQRIAIARLFLKNPAIVILDEATASLDNASEKAVQQALDALLAGRTTLTVAHRLTTIRYYDVIIVIDRGSAAEVGTYDELLALKGLLYNLVEGGHELE
jgi:ATP-binding cassette subfamily B protein